MRLFKSSNKPLKRIRNRARNWILEKKCNHLITQLKPALSTQKNTIPVLVVSYNNGIYVENITRQLQRFSITPIIFDNHSSCKKTRHTLDKLEQDSLACVIRSRHNFGHMIGFLKPIYDLLPNVFCYTDPDLQFNKDLPDDFISTLVNLTTEYSVFKAGFALLLHGNTPLKDTKFYSCHYKPIYYEKYLSIEEFESKYWAYRLKHEEYELYAAPIDTTFAAYRKSNYTGDFYRSVRVAGNFSAIHLPWFKELDLLTEEDKTAYMKKNISSNWSK